MQGMQQGPFLDESWLGLENQKRKIHVCFVVDYFTRVGGVQTIVANLANYLPLEQLTVDIVALKGDAGLHVRSEIKVFSFGSSRMSHSLTKLKDYFKERHPDIILASYEEVVCITLAARILSGIRADIIWWQHVHFSSQLRYASKTVREIVGKYMLYFIASRFMKRIVAVSRGVKRDMARALFLSDDVIAFLESPNLPIVKPLEEIANSNEEKPRFVFIGRLCAQKQVHHILEAVSFLPSDICIQLDIIGDGEDRVSLADKASNLPGRHQVLFHGQRDKPWDAVKGKYVLILSSLYEGYGLVIREAMSLGIPVISYDSPSGPSEIIQDGVNGFIVPAQDTRALSKSIERIWRDSSLYDSLRAGARNQSSTPDFGQSIQQFANLILSEATSGFKSR